MAGWTLRHIPASTILAFLLAVAVSPSVADEAAGPASRQPRELGAIKWQRDFDTARSQARAKQKPMLVLFDEVPGCDNCTSYGAKVLSHPLVVEAIESHFVPVAIYNNVKGADERVLRSFKEPAWNNPVLRIIDADRHELAPRVTFESGIAGLMKSVIAALEKARQPVPAYITLLAEEYDARTHNLEHAVFAMPCFWEGEARLGQLNGVIQTRPGYLKGNEVVEVQFDSTRISFESLVKHASLVECATHIFTRSDRQQAAASRVAGHDTTRTDETIQPDREPKYYLAHTPLAAFKYLPMTETQACRTNAALRGTEEWTRFLSPRQIELLKNIRRHKQAGWKPAIGKDMIAAWTEAQAISAKLP